MIKCEKLTKYYGKEKKAAIDSIDLTVEENLVFGFLGPNGAGKTTTIKILCGLMRQSSGKAWISGEAVEMNAINFRKNIGYLGQDQKIYGWMKGREALLFVGEIFGLSKKEREKRADEMLEMAGLTKAAKKKIAHYSGGMKQRLGIAQAMIHRPKILFLDEPTSALDPLGRKEVLDFISEIKSQSTVFMSTHILSDVERVCEKLAIIHEGKIILQESMAALKEKYSSKILQIDFSHAKEASSFAALLEKSAIAEKYKTEDKSIAIFPYDSKEAKRSIIKILHENAIDIEGLHTKQASLEDVFVSLIGKQNEN
jgi:ABC-2 type transport system ATP-binding protein